MLTQQTIKQISVKNQEPSWLLKEREESFNQFSSMPIPSFKYGLGIYTSLSGLNIDELNLSLSDEFQVKAGKEINILSLNQAIEAYPEEVKLLFSLAKQKQHKLSAFHNAFFNSFLCIVIPRNTELNSGSTIHIHKESRLTEAEYILIIAEENSKASILETIESSESPQLNPSTPSTKQQLKSQVILINAKENSKIQYSTLQNLSKQHYHLSQRHAFLKKDAELNWVDCFLGSKFTQCNTLTTLQGTGSQTTTNGILYADQEQCFDIDSASRHLAGNTSSNMLTRAVLNDKAKAVYRGLVRINKNARNCRGYQKEETLMLSEEAQSNAVPNLEIENNEVSCTHGATMSSIDKEKLFYLSSRGINESTAKKAIIQGFLTPIIEKLPSQEHQEAILSSITERLGAIE